MNRRQILKLLPAAAVATAVVGAGAESAQLSQPTEAMSFDEWLRQDLKRGAEQRRADRAAGIVREPEIIKVPDCPDS